MGGEKVLRKSEEVRQLKELTVEVEVEAERWEVDWMVDTMEGSEDTRLLPKTGSVL